MEAKKSIKIIALVAIIAVIIFLLVVGLNLHLDSKGERAAAPIAEKELVADNSQSYTAANLPVINDDDFTSGKHEGALSIIVYEDYADRFSADLDASLIKAQAEFGDKIEFAYRPFNANNSSLSDESAIAVRCAADSGKGTEFRQKILAAVKDNKSNPDNFVAWAEELGINKADFQSCLTNPEKKGKIEEVAAAAENFSVYGAPTIFIGDEMIVGARPYDTYTDSNNDQVEGLKQVIARQLK